MINKIKQFFNNRKITKSNVQQLIKNQQIKLFLNQLYQQHKDRFSFFIFVKYLVGDLLFKRCIVCGNYIGYNQLSRGRYNYCSKKCSNKDLDRKTRIKQSNIKTYQTNYNQILQKRKQTNIQRYGTQFPIFNQSIRKKTKKTNLQRYGVENVFANKQIKQKIKQTNLEKYGSENPFFSNEIKQKIKQTNLQKYGSETIGGSLIIRQRIQQTNLKKYGTVSTLSLENIKQKIKQTNLEKYGSENYFSSNDAKRKYFNATIKRIKDFVIPMFDFSEYHGFSSKDIYNWKCIKCQKIFSSNVDQYHFNGDVLSVPKCPYCYQGQNNISLKEKQVRQFCQNFSCCQFNNRNIIKPYQIDIYIPDKKLGIEFDGLVWHSNKFNPNDFNLLNKTQLCQNLGIKLIHVFEDQWIYQRQFVQKMIKLNFQQNINIFEYAEFKENNKYVFDRRYFSKFDFNNHQIEYIQPTKFYIKNNRRLEFDQKSLPYIYDCGKIIIC